MHNLENDRVVLTILNEESIKQIIEETIEKTIKPYLSNNILIVNSMIKSNETIDKKVSAIFDDIKSIRDLQLKELPASKTAGPHRPRPIIIEPLPVQSISPVKEVKEAERTNISSTSKTEILNLQQLEFAKRIHLKPSIVKFLYDEQYFNRLSFQLSNDEIIDVLNRFRSIGDFPNALHNCIDYLKSQSQPQTKLFNDDKIKQYITASEMERRTGVTDWTLIMWANKKLIPFHDGPFGRKMFIENEVRQALLKSKKVLKNNQKFMNWLNQIKQNKLMTVNQFCKKYGISYYLAQQLIKKHNLKTVENNGYWSINEMDLKNVLV